MSLSRIALCCLFLALSQQASLAQGWPGWADDAFSGRSSWRSQPPYYPGEPAQRPLADAIQDGGARPEIAPRTPPIVAFSAAFPANSIVIDAGARKLYYVLNDNRAYEYAVSVGREGFNWTGIETVSRQQAWPDWHPPAEMRERDPSLPEKMTGGLRNPLGAVALYLGNTLYRIHGTNDVKSIGRAQSSGCFRMLNADVLHLASVAQIGTTVSVVNSLQEGQQISRVPETTRPAPDRMPGSSPASLTETRPSDRARHYQAQRDLTLRRP